MAEYSKDDAVEQACDKASEGLAALKLEDPALFERVASLARQGHLGDAICAAFERTG